MKKKVFEIEINRCRSSVTKWVNSSGIKTPYLSASFLLDVTTSEEEVKMNAPSGQRGLRYPTTFGTVILKKRING
ncbi:hypothetical protein TNCV_4155631 [Trichonephila clavipes]|nr:hypothetical protein TNCV_4155631 [Trichonephila clavipes]